MLCGKFYRVFFCDNVGRRAKACRFTRRKWKKRPSQLAKTKTRDAATENETKSNLTKRANKQDDNDDVIVTNIWPGLAGPAVFLAMETEVLPLKTQ